MDWLELAQTELTELEAAAKADPNTYVHKDGIRTRGVIDGTGALRARAIAEGLADVQRRAGALVRS